MKKGVPVPLDSSQVTYSPEDITDWLNDVDPGDVDDALDQLAAEKSAVTGLPNVNNAAMRADGTLGDIQDSKIIIEDNGAMTGVRSITGESAIALIINSKTATIGINSTLQGGAGSGGAGGDARLVGGTATGDAGDANVQGGAVTSSGKGGSVNILATNGVGTDKDGGNCNYTAGSNTGSGTNGKHIFDRTIESDTDSTDDLGTSSVFWKDIYVDNVVGSTVFNEAGDDKDFRFEGDTDQNLLFTDASTDRVGVGTATPAAKVHIEQASLTAAIPVLTLDQSDLDEDFFKFIGKSSTLVDRALVDAVDFTTPGSIVGWLKINIQDDSPVAPIVNGDYYIPFYSAPTA